MKIQTKDLALISIFSAACIVVGYGKGLALPYAPGGIEFMSVIIFVSGLMFGWFVGALNGAVSLTIYMLVPYPFAHPAAGLIVISPTLLIVMSGLGAFYGLVGGLLRRRYSAMKMSPIFVVEMAVWGFLLTFIYDVLGSVGMYLAYPMFYFSVWDAIYLTFIPLYTPYPPIIHTFTNSAVFAYMAPPLTKAIRKLPTIINKKHAL